MTPVDRLFIKDAWHFMYNHFSNSVFDYDTRCKSYHDAYHIISNEFISTQWFDSLSDYGKIFQGLLGDLWFLYYSGGRNLYSDKQKDEISKQNWIMACREALSIE